MMEINDGNVMFGNFRHKRIGSTTGTLSSSTCKSWWQFPGSAHGQSPSNSRHFCAFVSRTCKLKDLTAIWCAGPDECRTIWECFEFQLISCPRKNPYSLTSTKQRFLETQCGACTLVSLVRYCSRRCFGNWCLNWCVRERVRDDTFIHSSYIIDS